MNPNSHYYLSFNVGYPNAYDRAYGRTGGNVMVHGVCSSAGCFSMTDEQVADIYAIARDAFARRPARNPAAVLSVPHDAGEPGQIPARSQHRVLERAEERLRPFRGHQDRAVGRRLRQALRVRRDGRRARFRRPRPVRLFRRDDEVEALVAEKEAKDDAKVAELAASGVKAIRTVYADGGQNPVFAGYKDDERPGGAGGRAAGDRAERRCEACAGGGEDRGRRRRQAARGGGSRPGASGRVVFAGRAQASSCRARLAASADQPASRGASTQNVRKWLRLGGEDQALATCGHRLCPRPADSDRRSVAAPSRRPLWRRARSPCMRR